MATHSFALADPSVPLLPPAGPESASTQVLLEGFLRREELAQQLGVSPRTIDRWHTSRCGPPRVTVGRTILYNLNSVREWLRSREESADSPVPRKRSRRNCN